MNVARWVLATIFVSAGVLHFRFEATLLKAMPAFLPKPAFLVQLSGVCEMAGGVGLLIPSTRRWAAWGLVALLVAVLPANVQMAMHPEQWPGIPGWALWARLPMQLPLIAWAWLFTRKAA